jgi:hypothetical protein
MAHSIRRHALAMLFAGAASAVAGAVLLFGLQPSTDISDDKWRYPWSSSGAFVAFSLFSATLHALVIVGVLAVGRSGAAGRSRVATTGVALAAAGTCLLLLGELASIPICDAGNDDGGVALVGALFGVASIVSTVGFLTLGWATLRAGAWHGWRRFTPLATGVWLVAVTAIGVPFPSVLHGMVGVYGLTLAALALALYTDPTPAGDRSPGEVQVRPA